MFSRKYLNLAMFVVFMASSSSAFAGISLFGVGVSDSPSASGVTGATYGSSFGFGGGALLDFRVAPMLAIELGGMYFNRQFTVSGITVAEPILEIPVGLRVWLAHWIGIGAGGFYNFGTGQVSETQGSLNRSANFGDLSLVQQDYGIYGSLRLNFPVGAVSLFAEGRYNAGLSNSYVTPIANAGGSFKYNDIVTMVGVTIGMGGSR